MDRWCLELHQCSIAERDAVAWTGRISETLANFLRAVQSQSASNAANESGWYQTTHLELERLLREMIRR